MITVIGSLNYDYVTYTTTVPNEGETIKGISFEEHLGGKGLNESIAASRLSPVKGHVQIWGKIGDDEKGSKMLKELKASEISVALLEVLQNGVSTGSATILVEDNGDNRIIIVPGANGLLRPSESELSSVFQNEEEKQYVILQNEFPNPLHIIQWLSENKPHVKKFYNPSPIIPELIDLATLNKVEYLVVNETESMNLLETFETSNPELYKNCSSSVSSADDNDNKHLNIVKNLNNYFSYPTVIVTLGSLGSYVLNSQTGEIQFFKSVKVDKSKAVDTTGAGDTFLGGIASSLYFNDSKDGNQLYRAVEFATVASALAIQTKGAVESIPYYETVIEEYKRLK